MRNFATVLGFIALTFLCWGVYGPILHIGQHEMSGSSLRPFICVGMAYFLVAVVVPIAILWTSGENGHWTVNGTIWSLAAGVAGAVGALGIIMAFKFRGNPLYVMPLVFGFAPVVNTFVTMWMTKTFREAGILFFCGIVVVAVGASGVLFFKPSEKAHGNEVEILQSNNGSITIIEIPAKGPKKTWEAANEKKLMTDKDLRDAYKLYRKHKKLGATEIMMIVLSVVMTALCWGSYGPVLHKGQMKMAGSRWRPLLCVGLAYMGIAVIVPIIVLGAWNEPGSWNWTGVIWSLVAGIAGAVGALGIIMAFNFGGRPIFVMPLVFGGAPVVNTIFSIVKQRTFTGIRYEFLISLLLVIGGAVTVLVFSPKPHKKPAAAEADSAAGEGDEKSDS